MDKRMSENETKLESKTIEQAIAELPVGYNERVAAYLEKIGVEFKVELLGNDCPRWCEQKGKGGADVFPRREHIHGKHYLVTFRRPSNVGRTGMHYKAFTMDFWNSYKDEEFNWLRGQRWNHNLPFHLFKSHGLDQQKWGSPKPKLPTPYDVLACAEKCEPDLDFERWCAEFGYDTDSRRAEETWKAVIGEWNKVRGFFTEGELEVLREIAQ